MPTLFTLCERSVINFICRNNWVRISRLAAASVSHGTFEDFSISSFCSSTVQQLWQRGGMASMYKYLWCKWNNWFRFENKNTGNVQRLAFPLTTSTNNPGLQYSAILSNSNSSLLWGFLTNYSANWWKKLWEINVN